jgi:hypothetical protein
MIQLWIEIRDREDNLRLEWLLREGGFAFYDPSVASSETFDELETRLTRGVKTTVENS